jgi:H+/gluconate symporter-like permease
MSDNSEIPLKVIEHIKMGKIKTFLMNIDESAITGLIFATIFCIFATYIWISIVFRDGTKNWQEGIIAWNKRTGIDTKKNDLAVHPFVLKTIASCFLIFSLFFLFLAIRDLVGN